MPSSRPLAAGAVLGLALVAAAAAWTLRDRPAAEAPMRTILVTGFGPFGEYESNPAWESVRGLEGATVGRSRIRTARIDVVYATAGRELEEAIRRTNPDVVLSLGVAPDTDLRIETTARNRDTSTAPDNAGVVRSDHAIRESGPATYATRLPVEPLLAALRAGGYPVRTSADAGGYLCNRLFYELMDRAGDLRMAGFVHVPALGGAWDLPRLSAAVRRILETLDAAAAP